LQPGAGLLQWRSGLWRKTSLTRKQNRMISELSEFAARLRQALTSCGRSWVTAGENTSVAATGRASLLTQAAPIEHQHPLAADFSTLAIELFGLQFRHNQVYRRLCEASGVTPDTLSDWTAIPCVPTATFKEMEVTCLPAAERLRVFCSSGTTTHRPSRHFHNAESLALYEASAWTWFARQMMATFQSERAPVRLAVLTPPPAQVAHSSLVHMFEVVRRNLGAAETVFLGRVTAAGEWELPSERVIGWLRTACASDTPSLVLGTAFNLVHLMDRLSAQGLRFALPPGSRVMETGGYKGRSRSLPKAELHAMISDRLGVPPSHIVCEYGMSELSSQAYAGVAGAPAPAAGESGCGLPTPADVFRFPPWARAQVMSPETGCEVGEGETGLIRVFDLANVFSVMAIQTEDLGVRRGAGFELVGRAGWAEPRGCSLLAAEA